MIARDSADTIGRALESVRPIATQIVVVDTGSLDATPTLAARSGAEVYFHRWRDNFSVARNWALGYLRTDWALVLDTDEVLDRESFERCRHLLAQQHLGGIEVSIVNALDGSAYHEHRYTRIVRCHPTIRFSGTIHEQIADAVRAAGYDIAKTDIRILHTGYQRLSPEKIERNIALLEMELSAQPESVWHRYHLGLAEFARGNLARARSLLEPIRNSAELSSQQQELATIRCAQCALACDDFLGAERLLAFTSADRHREGLRLFVLAAVLAAQRQFPAAVELLGAAPVCQSSLVDQQQRALFAERLATLAQHRAHPKETIWQTDRLWRATFR
ncbi:MAG: hypothetical protein KatS3mg039_1650 [Candidatus Kapaibacterium sp.]|nr:MAG: hypothetical protein KatS3mg039_1650 [Candidatus Kapabacteria bacterium]